MRSKRRLQGILQELEKLDEELKNLASGCEFTKHRRLCLESQALLHTIHSSLEKGFNDIEDKETYTSILDRI